MQMVGYLSDLLGVGLGADASHKLKMIPIHIFWSSRSSSLSLGIPIAALAMDPIACTDAVVGAVGSSGPGVAGQGACESVIAIRPVERMVPNSLFWVNLSFKCNGIVNLYTISPSSKS